MFRPTPYRSLLLACALALAAAPAPAADPWALCTVGVQTPPAPVFAASDPELLEVRADEADLWRDQPSFLRGDVELAWGPRRVRADELLYDHRLQYVESPGEIRFWDTDLYIAAARGHFELDTDRGWLENADYRLPALHGHGSAEDLRVFGKDKIRLREADYTTCDPGKTDWLVTARTLDIDRGEDVAVGRDVKVRFKDRTVLYTPYLSFPLSDRRKSGLLTPTFGSTDETGIDIRIPYYWNIAPERDATLALRAMTKRGPLLEAEYRYLLTRGRGLLAVEQMPEDRMRGDSRGLYRLEHMQNLAPRLQGILDLAHVTDEQYFEDLGTSLEVASTAYLERRADLVFAGDSWKALGRLQHYQTLGLLEKPYARLPQLLFQSTLPERTRAFNASVRGELVHFDRSEGVVGSRIDLEPAVSYPLRGPGSFLIPRVALRHTQYALDRQAPGQSGSPSRTLPTFSVDGGLFLDREVGLGSTSFSSSLEPRLFYLYVPRKDQADLPVFDTSEFTFDFGQLFRTNRFVGADRVGDANQLTFALTSRLTENRTGRERARVSLGQVRYLEDRKVTLPGAPTATQQNSDLIAEAIVAAGRGWHLGGSILWDPDSGESDRDALMLRYRPDPERVLNLSYRRIQGVIEQTDLSAFWPVDRQWSLMGRLNYDLPESRAIEYFAGAAYESCCWSTRAVLRRFLTGDRSEYSTGFFVQVELKGLSGLGRGTESFLREQIPGYGEDF